VKGPSTSQLGGSSRFGHWLDVYKNVCHPRQLPSNHESDIVGNVVSLPYGHLRIHLQMQIYVILQASIARKQFLHARHPGHCESNFADLIDETGIWHCVAELCGRVLGNSDACKYDDYSHRKATVVIGSREAGRIP